MSILKIRSLTKRFAGVEALVDVDLDVKDGELLALIGPNGSGKTTLFNCITGVLQSDGGRVLYKGRDITHMPPHVISRMGVGRTFQLVRIFSELSVIDNMVLALQDHQENSFLGRVLRSPRVRDYERQARVRAMELLGEVGLESFAESPARTLSYGQRKLLTFALALMPDPDLLLLDEPAAAVNPTMINHIKEYIHQLHSKGKTIVLIEHNMDVVMDLAERIVVLDHGRVIAEGSPEDIRNDERVIEAYFGR